MVASPGPTMVTVPLVSTGDVWRKPGTYRQSGAALASRLKSGEYRLVRDIRKSMVWSARGVAVTIKVRVAPLETRESVLTESQ